MRISAAEAMRYLKVTKAKKSDVTEDVLVTVHRKDGTTYDQHRKSGKAKPKPAAKTSASGDDDKMSVVQKASSGGLDLEHVPKGLHAKAKAAAKEVWLKANTLIMRMSPAAIKIGGLLGNVFDTPDDMKKFAYNPSTSGTIAGHANNDFVAANMNDAFGVGLSGHIVASIASKVLAKAIMYAKGKIKGKPGTTEDADAGIMEFAEFMHRTYKHAFKTLGVDGEVPSTEDLVKTLTQLINRDKDAAEGFTGVDSHGHKWVDGKQVAKDEESGGETKAKKVKTGAPKVSALKKNPNADKEHLDKITEAAPNAEIKDAIETAAYNIPGPKRDMEPQERRNKTLDRLAAVWRDVLDLGQEETADYVLKVLEEFGASGSGPDPGSSVAYDGLLYGSPDGGGVHGAFTGDPVTVVRRPIVGPDGYVAVKGIAR